MSSQRTGTACARRGSTLASLNTVRFALLASLLSVLVVAGGCIAGNGGAAMFPARYDVGPATTTSSGRTETGVHYAAGLSWASFNPKPTSAWDIVVGYALEDFGQPESKPSSDPVPAAAPSEPIRHLVHGPFVEVAQRIVGDGAQRVWLGLKGETLFDRGDAGDGVTLGASTRLSWELFRGLKRSSRSAGIEGVFAIGLFAEAGMRRASGARSAAVALGGLTIRVPAAGVR